MPLDTHNLRRCTGVATPCVALGRSEKAALPLVELICSQILSDVCPLSGIEARTVFAKGHSTTNRASVPALDPATCQVAQGADEARRASVSRDRAVTWPVQGPPTTENTE